MLESECGRDQCGGLSSVCYCFCQAYMDTLQTQWSWILQITKCIDVHLKENAAYFQVSSEVENSHQFCCV